MPRLTPDLQEAVRRGIIDWAIREHFSLRVTDPLPLMEEVSQDDVEVILEKIHTIRGMNDFFNMARTN